MKINKKIIKELSDYLDEFNLTELEYTEKDTKIKVSKNNISVNNQNIPIPKNDLSSIQTSQVPKEKKSALEIKSFGFSATFGTSTIIPIGGNFSIISPCWFNSFCSL